VTVRVVFAEELEGSFRLGASPREARMRLRLEGQSPVSSLLLGERVMLEGHISADGLLAPSSVSGEVRLERARAELVYSLATADTAAMQLHGRKRCLFADPYAGLTTLSLALVRSERVVGHAVLRFDPRGQRRAGLAGMRLRWG
jgi:hypothetical protein